MKRLVLGLLIGSSVLHGMNIQKKSCCRRKLVTYIHTYRGDVTRATKDITNAKKPLYTVESSGTTYKIFDTVAKTIFERLEREYNYTPR